MTKKDKKSNETNETDIESVDEVPSEAADESAPFDATPQEEVEEQISATAENESSSDDLLQDVRRSLIEAEETDKSKKEAKWWRRLGRREKSTEPDSSPPLVEIDLPATASQSEMSGEQQATEPEEYGTQINDLIDTLQTEHQESDADPAPVAAEAELSPEPEPEIDLEQLKEQAFRPRPAELAETERDVRSIALEGGEEVFVEVEVSKVDPFDERIKALENALKPYRSYLYMTLALLGVVMAVIASLLIYNAYRQSRPAPVQEASNLPYPVAVSLPGGWSFNLGKGTLRAGQWEPNGAEWLEGTEVCRWVSLPWSRQLEAVVRTLNAEDPIELVMSNNDKLVYGVSSVEEMTPEEIQKLDSNSACLLLILTASDSGERWVLTAVP